MSSPLRGALACSIFSTTMTSTNVSKNIKGSNSLNLAW